VPPYSGIIEGVYNMKIWKHFSIVAVLVFMLSNRIVKIAAEEIFNKPIVETFSEMIGDEKFHFAGVDTTGDGFADLFINVPYVGETAFFTRLAGFLKEGVMVSFDDTRKSFNRGFGAYELDFYYILEINSRSILQIFPGLTADFSAEAARQRRLQSQNN
jgi:hypothetical protein